MLLKRGQNAGITSLTEPFTESQRHALERSMNSVYERFIQCIVRGRVMNEERVRRLATGQVWTGERAVELGLVDHIGGLHDALALARELGELDEDSPVEAFPKPMSIFEQIDQTMNPGVSLVPQISTLTPRSGSAEMISRGLSLSALLEREPVLTYFPIYINIR